MENLSNIKAYVSQDKANIFLKLASAPHPIFSFSHLPASLRIGVFKGTFNPVHNGHISIVKDSIRQYNLDYVVFIPVPRPSHKQKENLLAPYLDRLNMLRLATLSQPNMLVCQLPSSYDWNNLVTILNYIDPLHRQRKIPLFILRGTDALTLSYQGGSDQKIPEDLLYLRPWVHFLHAERKKLTINSLADIQNVENLYQKYDLRISSVKESFSFISAHLIRESLRVEKSMSDINPDVYQYIQIKGLYVFHHI